MRSANVLLVTAVQMINKPVYLIHGWGLGSGTWTTFIDSLHYQGNIQALELPGYGQSKEKHEKNNSIDEIVDQLSGQISNDAILIGWSLGGMIAIKLAETKRSKISALILLASTPCFVKKTDWPCGVDENKLQQIAIDLKHDKNKVLQTFIAEVAMGDPSPRETILMLQDHATKNSLNAGVLNDGLEILRKQDLRKNLKQLNCSIGMILGTNDQLVDFSTGQATLSICPNMELMVIEEAGHAPFVSQPRETANAIKSFVEKL